MITDLQAHYGLKWNPFSPDVPLEGMLATPAVEHFTWRVEQLSHEGGFALLTGEPGTGKSVILRLVVRRLSLVRDLQLGVLTRPHGYVSDVYRELGDLFGVSLSPHNRWAGSKVLRERWRAHIESTLFRPVLIIDEAQEMRPAVLNELRLLASADLDSRALLTVVLAGDQRLTGMFRAPDLVPLGTRIRVRLAVDAASPQELAESLRHALDAAGAAHLMTPALIEALATHSAGNRRVLMNLAAELLAAGVSRNLSQLDEQLFFAVCGPPAPPARAQARRR